MDGSLPQSAGNARPLDPFTKEQIMRLLEIIHVGKDEYGNDGHNAVIELDDGSIIYLPEKRGGVEFENKFQCPDCGSESLIEHHWHCPRSV